ncbi:FadR/GntR family transcriptional regulator [Novosphingobium colocasiae]
MVESPSTICEVQNSSRMAADDVNETSTKPVRAKRAFERVSEAILQDIREEKLRPGDKLPSERALADAFSVNRHAVREALRTLEMSGVLRFAKGGQRRSLHPREQR